MQYTGQCEKKIDGDFTVFLSNGEITYGQIPICRPVDTETQQGAQEVAPLNQAKGSARGDTLRGISTRIILWKTN